MQPSAVKDYRSGNAGIVGQLSAKYLFYLCAGETITVWLFQNALAQGFSLPCGLPIIPSHFQ